MDVDLQKIFARIDARLLSNQSITPRKLARELNLTVQDIEAAIREAEHVAFSEYKRYRRLVNALRILNDQKDSIQTGNGVERRTRTRWTLPHTTVRYHLYARGITRSRFSRLCPVRDLGQTGMSFLSDRYLKPERMVSMLLASAGKIDRLQLEGRIIYASAINVDSYRYCVGIQFAPFDGKPSHNSPDALKALAELEQAVASRKPQRLCAAGAAHVH